MRILPILTAAALAFPSMAHACGGFFCNTTPNVPGGPVEVVDQAGEEVLFYRNTDAGTVTMHVQVAYEGEASDFAWVIPVMGNPEIELSTEAIFPILGQLRAQYQVNADLSACRIGYGTGTGTGGTGTGGAWTSSSPGTVPGVEVVSSGAVGPYETVVLTATDSGALVTWLTNNDFELPVGLDALLANYISPDTHFVALRLQKDASTGDLQPIALTYPGDVPAIPIQLTSVAATPDMRLRVYVAGDFRAVPLSYLHVQLNPLAIDTWNGGPNLDEVITRAADEAGGHAFFTDYAGPTDPLLDQVFLDDWDLTDLSLISDTEELLTVVALGMPLDDRMLGVLSDHLGIPAHSTVETDLADVIECLTSGGPSTGPGCYTQDLSSIHFDPVALAADVETYVLGPRRRIEAVLETAPKITRLTSSISPAEMTVDPTFGFNHLMEDVEVLRELDEVYECVDFDFYTWGERTLTTQHGDQITLPSINEIGSGSPFWWLEEQGYTTPAALVIERTTEDTLPDTVVDNSHEVFGSRGSDADPIDGSQTEPKSCGCTSSGPAAGWLFTLPLLVGLRRRPRRS